MAWVQAVALRTSFRPEFGRAGGGYPEEAFHGAGYSLQAPRPLSPQAPYRRELGRGKSSAKREEERVARWALASHFRRLVPAAEGPGGHLSGRPGSVLEPKGRGES